MKWILIFIFFFIVGCGLVIGYAYQSHKQIFFTVLNSPITTKFSLENAPEDSLKGTIASMSGTVNWQSRTAKTFVQLKSPRLIQQGEELSTGRSGKAGVLIQKAAAIILSPNSDVNFIQMLPINLVMEQDKGTVIYQDAGQSAMSVKTLDLITAVNRAWAVISVDSKTQTVTVIAQKSSITEGYVDSQGNSNVVTVNAGQKFVFDDTTQEGTVE